MYKHRGKTLGRQNSTRRANSLSPHGHPSPLSILIKSNLRSDVIQQQCERLYNTIFINWRPCTVHSNWENLLEKKTTLNNLENKCFYYTYSTHPSSSQIYLINPVCKPLSSQKDNGQLICQSLHYYGTAWLWVCSGKRWTEGRRGREGE